MEHICLLLVDDEVPLLRLMERFLRKAGYEVRACASGENAWSVFQRNRQAFGAAIIDLGLPDLPGEELVRRLRSIRPDVPVIICSGTPPGEALMSIPGTGFLQKPFLPQTLTEIVGQTLEDRAAQSH